MKNKIYSKLIILLALVLCLAACDGAVHLPNAQIVFVNISFNANGGSGEMDDLTVEQNVTTKLSSNTFTRVGYTFDGWNTKADGTGTSYTNEQSVTLVEDITLYAIWAPKSYTVYMYTRVDYNEPPLKYYYGTIAGLTYDSENRRYSATYKVGDTLPTVEPPHNEEPYTIYSFDSWHDNKEGDGDAFTTIPARDTTEQSFYVKYNVAK